MELQRYDKTFVNCENAFPYQIFARYLKVIERFQSGSNWWSLVLNHSIVGKMLFFLPHDRSVLQTFIPNLF